MRIDALGEVFSGHILPPLPSEGKHSHAQAPRARSQNTKEGTPALLF